MNPELIGRKEPSPLRYAFTDDLDSSAQESTSGEESIDEQPPKKRTRAWLNSDEGAHELENKYKKFREYQAGFERIGDLRDQRVDEINEAAKKGLPRPPENPDHSDAFLQIGHEDFLLLYFCNKGAVSSLIEELASRQGDEARVPNRVLWSFWLCSKSTLRPPPPLFLFFLFFPRLTLPCSGTRLCRHGLSPTEV